MNSIFKIIAVVLVGKLLILSQSVFASATPYSLTAESCSSIQAKRLSAVSSPNTEESYFYNSNAKGRDKEVIVIPRCLNKVGKYLMIQSGVRQLSQIGAGYSILFTDDPDSLEVCSVQNIPRKHNVNIGYNELLKTLHQDNKILNKCILRKIIDNGGKLTFPVEQEDCQIKSIDNKSAYFSGGHCFFNVTNRSQFTVEFSLNSNCSNEQFLKKENIAIKAISTDIVYNYTNSFEIIEALFNSSLEGHTELDYLIEAPSYLLPLSEAYGEAEPKFPSYWIHPNVHLGKPRLIEQYGDLNVMLPLYASNTCKEVCKDELCSSPCNYNSPLIAKATLFEVKGKGDRKHKKNLASWYQGLVLTPQWQGSASKAMGIIKNFQGIVKAKNQYQIQVKFGDPRYDYLAFSRQMKSMLGNIPSISGISLGSGTLPTLGGIGLFNGLSDLGSLPTLTDDSNLHKKLANILESLRLISNNNNIWPPFYEGVCLDDFQTCNDKIENHTVFVIDFQVDEFIDVGGKREAQISNVIVKKRSKSDDQSYILNMSDGSTQWPQIDCDLVVMPSEE